LKKRSAERRAPAPAHDAPDRQNDAVEQRRAVRALLVDPLGALLLMQITDPADGRSFWITPGGGLEPDEDAVGGLCRELHEELGFQLDQTRVGPKVWDRRHSFTWDGRDYDQAEEFFLVMVERFTPDHCADGEPGAMFECPHRWWRADEITASDERFAPTRLGHALAALVEHGAPPEPVDVGW
jgi:8-oxo-dGTP pyrophosphatase MutT (NUDIX family)